MTRLTDELITSRLTTTIGITRNRIKHTRHTREILFHTAEFTLIRESLKTIDELQDKLSTLEGFIHCPECGAKIEKTSAFCSKCGAKIAETKPEDDDIDVVDTAEASETAGEEKTDETCTCETVPDEKFETEAAETTVNVTEDQE